MAVSQVNRENFTLANGQSRTVVGVIIEFELILKHNQYHIIIVSRSKEPLPYNFQRVRLGLYRGFEYMRMSSSG